jgi:hypothetical protein
MQTRNGVPVQVGISSYGTFGSSSHHYPASVGALLPWITSAAGLEGNPNANEQILIFGSGNFGDPTSLNNAKTVLDGAGYSATVAASDALPADLTPYAQVWHVSTSPPSVADQDRLVAFARAGGGVYLTGERPCCEGVNASAASIVNRLVVTVGGVQVGGLGDPYYAVGPLPVRSTVTGGLAARPFSLTTWQPAAPGGIGNVSGDNVFVLAPDEATPVAAAWGRDDVVGGGALVLMMDINWLEPSYWDATTAPQVAQNVALFLSGLSSPPAQPQAVVSQPALNAAQSSDVQTARASSPAAP